MALPKRIVIHELGPREGMQIEKNPIDTSEKVRLVDTKKALPLLRAHSLAEFSVSR